MNTELLRALRDKTCASMNDCRIALQEASDDFDKALDIIKIRGQQIADSRASKVAAEGVIVLRHSALLSAMVECNTQTDFTARSPEFIALADKALNEFVDTITTNTQFDPPAIASLEEARKELIAKTKENIVVRRWFFEESLDEKCRVFSYLHNGKIGVLLSLLAETVEQANSKEFDVLGNDLAMQIAACAPLAISIDKIAPEVVERQKAIFVEQVKEMGKPEGSWGKIIEGKERKWFSEVALVEQASVIDSKKTVKQLLGNVKVSNYHRAVVGEGILVETKNLAEEVAKTIDQA